MQFRKDWEYYVNRSARWVDFDNDYRTMDLSYMESVMWAFKTLWDKGLVYEGYRVVPYSWAAQTPLSNFETRLDNAYAHAPGPGADRRLPAPPEARRGGRRRSCSPGRRRRGRCRPTSRSRSIPRPTTR